MLSFFPQTNGMNIKLKFLGAAQTVTGSKYLLELDHKKILIDAGLFQGLKELRLRNWDKLPVNPKEVDLVLLTHAHIDHVGYLPRLIKDGFKGKIICTAATADLAKIMLMDAAKLQEEEAIFAFKRGYSKHSKPEPLFTIEDAEQVITQLESRAMDKPTSIFKDVSIRFLNAGHILGASSIEMTIAGENQPKKIVFSGDIGRYHDPVMKDPVSIEETDVLIMESTYGDRVNPMGNVEETLKNVVDEALVNDGVIAIPAFAVGRTQTLIYYFHKMMMEKTIPTLPIYIDSPMAINVTDLYERHSSQHKIKVERQGKDLISIFDAPNIHFCHSRESSKALNDIKKPAIIISASGMCTGGRILHHMTHRLPREQDTFLFAGYQAQGTRGRDMLDGEKSVRIFGQDVVVRCQVRVVNGLSAHADQTELLQWLKGFKKAPKLTFITHGEPATAKAFGQTISAQFGWKTVVPDYLESFSLFEGI
jgi:metallo-beta-lactamase family protein